MVVHRLGLTPSLPLKRVFAFVGSLRSTADFFPERKNLSEGPARNPGGVAAAAVVATMAHEGTMTPIEVVKQRLQVHSSPYKGAMDCIRKTLAEEGVR